MPTLNRCCGSHRFGLYTVYFLLLLFSLLRLEVRSQSIVLKKGSDTLQMPDADAKFKIAFGVTGVTIGALARVTIIAIDSGKIQKNIDFALLGTDSIPADSLNINAKNDSGSFLLFIRGGLPAPGNIFLHYRIADGKRSCKGSIKILLISAEKPKEKHEEPKDSLIIMLTHDLNVRVHETKEMVNISTVTIEKDAAGKYLVTVTTADEVIYQAAAVDFTGNWQDSHAIPVLKMANDNTYLVIKDFIAVSSDKTKTLTLSPQNRTIKVSAEKQ
jgi:hypothetical protein